MSGYDSGGTAGPGQAQGTLPAGTAEGQLLQWTGTVWAPLAQGTINGQLLSWDDGIRRWVVGLNGNEAGQILEWSGSAWARKKQQLGQFQGGGQGLSGIADQFQGPSTYGVTGQAAEAQSGGWVFDVDCVIDRLFARHLNSAAGTANPVTYTVHVNGANTALVVTGNTNATGPFSDLVNSVNITAGDRFSIRCTWAAALAQQIRPAWAFRLQSRNVSA